MQKLLYFLALVVLTISLSFASPFQNNKGKNDNKEQSGNQGKGNDGSQDKGNQGQKGRDKGSQGNSNKGNSSGNSGKGNSGGDNQSRGNSAKDDKDKGGNGKGNTGNGQGNGDRVKMERDNTRVDLSDPDFRWDREKFKNRKQFRNGEKVTVCHKFNSGEPAVTLNVSANALKAHLGHGDVTGVCPAVTESRYTPEILNQRVVYYTVLQDNYEQRLYSRSILDYAIDRLTDARADLVVMRTNNVPAAEIERKEVIIVELERNVSALERLIGAAAELAVEKLWY